MRTVALDLGVRKITYCELREGAVVARDTVASFAQLDRHLGPGTPPALVAFEACREAWHVHDVLAARGHHPVMVDTTRVRQFAGVGHHGRKTDRLDAEALARALERGGIPAAHALSPARRRLRAELSVRGALVETRTQYVTTARGLARAAGLRLPSCQPENFARHARAAAMDDATRALLAPMLALLDALGAQLADLELRLEATCREEPAVALLATVPGVGLIVAATFVSALDEAGRFRDAHGVESYLGLVPSESSSGGARRLGAITKQGNGRARVALVQAAHSILRTAPAEDPLKLWALDVAARRTKPVAVVALARRLCGVLWAMWRDGTAYDPRVLAARGARGLAASAAEMGAQAERLAAIARAERKIYSRTRPPRAGAGKTTTRRCA